MRSIKWRRELVLVLLSAVLCAMIPLQAKAAAADPGGTGETVSDGLVLQDGHYVLYMEGRQVTETGWWGSNRESFRISQEGYVTAKMEAVGGICRFYELETQTMHWELQKDTWEVLRGIHADGREYYFDKKGICTKIYDPVTGKCVRYDKGKMVSVKKDVCTLRSGKMYFFDGKGIRVTQAGWQHLTPDKLVQTAKSGPVVSRMEKKNGYWRIHTYDYHTGKWKKQKKTWKTVNKKRYYLNAAGKCVRMYNTAARKCYDCKKGRLILVKNATRKIGRKLCYFRPDGVKASEAGLYLLSSKKLVYVRANGQVVKQISGQVQDYVRTKGKVTASRVKDSHYMCYYDGKGTLKRKINLNKKLVALTYDDGPSQYTPVILDVLERYKSVATFFVVGDRVPGFASTVARTYKIGCEIGDHTYSHTILTTVGIPTIQSQISMTDTVVKNITGASPVVMRPPGGGYNDSVRSAVGMPLIMWSIDTLDWKTRSAPATHAAVLGQVRDGDVVLMHDLHGPTAEASKTIIPELVDRGYQLVTVSELADCRGAMVKGGVYSAWYR